MVAAIEQACRETRLLGIRYPSGKASGKAIRNRAIEPLLMSRIEGTWYLNAYCRYAQAARLFRLERVLSARMLDEHFEVREDVELKTEYEDIDPRGYAAKRAVVRFSPQVARWMEERPALDLIEEHGNGATDYALYYTDESWAARRIMQYLGEAVMVEPEELRQEVHARASDLLAAYGEEA